MDDQLWHQAIVTERRLTEDLWCSPTTEDEKVLGYLLRTGAVDPGPNDAEWSTSVQAMRHSAAIGDRLWALLHEERESMDAMAVSVQADRERVRIL